jgi:hypothetical protein
MIPPQPFSTAFSDCLEVRMSRVITFDKGSKRRLKRIRWKAGEIVGAVLLSLIVSLLGLSLAVWEASHYPTAPKTHEVKAQP